MMASHDTNAESRDTLRAAVAMLKALANEHRLLMLCALAERPMAVWDLNRRIPIAQSALSQHLARLRTAGVVVAQRDGAGTRYALANTQARRLVAAVCAEYRIARADHAPPPDRVYGLGRVAGTGLPDR